jgi:hypothetical protein
MAKLPLKIILDGDTIFEEFKGSIIPHKDIKILLMGNYKESRHYRKFVFGEITHIKTQLNIVNV